MLLNLDLPCSEDFGNDTILISNEGRTDGTHCRLAIHLLFAISTERCNEGLVGIGYQRERKIILCNELFMTLSTLNADTYHGIALGKETLIIIPQVACLIRATWR